MLLFVFGSATLRAKKEYRQKTEQRPGGKRPRPPPSRSAPVAPPASAFDQAPSRQAPQQIVEEEDEEEGYVH